MLLYMRLFFSRQKLQRKVPKSYEQSDVLLEVLIQQPYVYAPVEVDKPIAQGDHGYHCLAEARVKITSLGQETKDVAAFLGMPELVDRDNVRRDIYTALNGSLKSALYGQAAREIILKCLQRDRLMFL
jgi:hypothetical protein